MNSFVIDFPSLTNHRCFPAVITCQNINNLCVEVNFSPVLDEAS